MTGPDFSNKAADRPFTPVGVGLYIGQRCGRCPGVVPVSVNAPRIKYLGSNRPLPMCPACAEVLMARRAKTKEKTS